jgi:hypothetical protein
MCLFSSFTVFFPSFPVGRFVGEASGRWAILRGINEPTYGKTRDAMSFFVSFKVAAP